MEPAPWPSQVPMGTTTLARQAPTALGTTLPQQVPASKPPARGLLRVPGTRIQQPGVKELKKGHSQAEIQPGYTALVC